MHADNHLIRIDETKNPKNAEDAAYIYPNQITMTTTQRHANVYTRFAKQPSVCSNQKQPKQVALLLRRHPHIRINRRTERRKANAASSRSLRTRLRTEDPARDATGRNAIRKIVLRAQALDAALCAGVEGANNTEVLGRGPGAGAHVFEAATELFAPGEVGEGGSLGGECGVVGHLFE